MARLNIVISVLFSAMLTVAFEADASGIKKAGKLYEEENYDEAVEQYDRVLLKNPEDSFAQYNRAAALYRKRAFAEAEEGFLKSLSSGKEEIEEKSVYNVGNSKYRLGEETEGRDPQTALNNYKQAVQYYQRAVELAPGDADAKYNYELTNKKIKELQEKMEQDKEQKQDKQKEEKDKDKKEKEEEKKSQEEKAKEQDKKEQKDRGEQKKGDEEKQESQKNEEKKKQEEQDKQEEQKEQEEQQKAKSEEQKKQEEERRKQENGQKDKGEKDSSESRETGMPEEESEAPEGEMTKQEAQMLLLGQEEEEARMRSEQRKARAARRPIVLRDW